MTIAQFVLEAEYPTPWVEHGLASGDFFEKQAEEFTGEYQGRKPRGGTEHWRYGSFLHWLRQELPEEKLCHLLEAALADPDPPMAGNVLKALLAHPASTDEMLQQALAAVAANPDYYVTPAELECLHSGRRVPGSNAA